MKAIRLHLKQNSANYRREETVNCRMTYPLPPYSTVIGAIHKACGYTDYHPMQVSIQGKYGSQKTRLFKDNCFLNSLQNDRNTLVKLRNPEMLSTAYDIVAVAQKAQGNDFEKGITINVVNKDLIEEYRFLKRTKRRIDKHKKIVKSLKDKAKKMKADKNISAEEVKAFDKRVKEIDKTYKKYEEVKYTIPYSKFRTLATGPKYYEMLYDIELVIHIVSDENTMQDILDNIYNLTAIGRGEDFVEVLECTETELEEGNIAVKKGFKPYPYDMYMPLKIIDENQQSFRHKSKKSGVPVHGTKYLLPKDYTVENLKGGIRKRNFNRVPVLYGSVGKLHGECDGIYKDIINDVDIAVIFA